METRSKRRRLMSVSSNVPQRPDLPAIFESLNDDTLTTVLEFVGKKSYRSFGGLNKHCKEVYLNTPGMTKETFLFGYAPLAVIINKIERALKDRDWELQERVGKGVVLYNRRDVLDWALEERNKDVLKGIFDAAATEGRIDLLNIMWNYIGDDADKRNIFKFVSFSAARGGKLDVLKWYETKGLPIAERGCAHTAARSGHIHIIQWLKEEKGLQLDGKFYVCAIKGNHLHVMKWLKEQEIPFHEWTFKYSACGANLNILQWLHDEGCPWPEDYLVYEHRLKPEVRNWLRTNGYIDRIIFGDDDDY